VLAALDGRMLTSAERTQVAVSRANILTWGLGRPDDAVALLDAIGSRELRSHAVPMLMFAGRVDEAIARSSELQDDPESSPVQRLRAALGAIPSLVAAGRPAAALTLAGEVVPLVPEASQGLPVAMSQLGAVITLAQLLAGDLATPEMLIRPAYDDGVSQNIPLLRGGAALRLGQIALWQGRPVTAAGLLREAVHALRQSDAGLLAWAWDTLRMASALVGDTTVGGPDDDVPRFGLFVTEFHRAEAAVAAASGELSAARDAARTGIAVAKERGHLIQATVLAFDLARFGDAQGAQAALPDGCEGALAEMMGAGITALADDDPRQLDAAADAFATRGYDLFAAEMARAAARAYGRAGLRDSERRADARADRLAAACEGARTPLVDDRPAATRLTPREKEIATLAARGVADTEIARRLGLSVRTVETHLHRCYSKLGVTGRHDLADYVT
jgi:DNA-binding CsgD family transcriptional regulator